MVLPLHRNRWGTYRNGLARQVEDLDDDTLKAISKSEVSEEYAALNDLVKDWTP